MELKIKCNDSDLSTMCLYEEIEQGKYIGSINVFSDRNQDADFLNLTLYFSNVDSINCWIEHLQWIKSKFIEDELNNAEKTMEKENSDIHFPETKFPNIVYG